MNKVFLSWKPRWYGSDPRLIILGDDSDRLRIQTQSIDFADRIWRGWLLEAGGSILSIGNGEGRAEVPICKLEELDKIRKRAAKALGESVTIGVGIGMSLYDSDRAMKLAERTGCDNVTFFTDETPAKLEELEEKAELSKADEIAKNPHVRGGGIIGASKASPAAAPQKPEPEGSEHSQGESMRTMAEGAQAAQNAQPNAEPTHSADMESRFGALADQSDQEDQAAEQQTAASQETQEIKQRVVQILKGLKDQAPQLQELQAVEPELYQSIQQITQALLIMAKQIVGAQQPVQKSERLEKLAGGRAEGMPDSAFKPEQIKAGTKEESEHTNDPQIAKEISKDHLAEDPNYYELDKEEAPMSKPLEIKHFSTTPGLKELDPKKQGTGSSGAERNRPKRIPRTYLYLKDTAPEHHISASAKHLYHGELPVGTKLYNVKKDPLKLMEPKWEQTKNGKEYHPADMDRVEKKLFKLGYDGYHSYGVEGAIAYFHPLSVRSADEKAEKAELPMPENAPKHIRHNWPVGTTKDMGPTGGTDAGKVKVRHPETGKTSWVEVKAGQIMSDDGHAISSRNPGGK